MPTYTLVVLTNAVEGSKAEFNDWYNNQHVPDMLKIPGVMAARRFKLAGGQLPGRRQPFRYLAIYDIQSENLVEVTAEIMRRWGTEALVISDTLASERVTSFFEPI